jgi:hypothetical protein
LLERVYDVVPAPIPPVGGVGAPGPSSRTARALRAVCRVVGPRPFVSQVQSRQGLACDGRSRAIVDDVRCAYRARSVVHRCVRALCMESPAPLKSALHNADEPAMLGAWTPHAKGPWPSPAPCW